MNRFRAAARALLIPAPCRPRDRPDATSLDYGPVVSLTPLGVEPDVDPHATAWREVEMFLDQISVTVTVKTHTASSQYTQY